MNTKDREALDKFVDEDSLSAEDTKRFAEMSDGERATFIAERFFEAGAKHGRADMKAHLDDNYKTLLAKVEYLNQVNDGLHLLLKEEESKYETLQAHDEMLIATVDKLKEENKKLRDALKFYADKNNPNFIVNLDYHDETDCDFHEDTQFTHFGKLARQVLKDVGEE